MISMSKVVQIWNLKIKLQEMQDMGAPPKEIEKLEDDIISLQTDSLSIFDEDDAP